MQGSVRAARYVITVAYILIQTCNGFVLLTLGNAGRPGMKGNEGPEGATGISGQPGVPGENGKKGERGWWIYSLS